MLIYNRRTVRRHYVLTAVGKDRPCTVADLDALRRRLQAIEESLHVDITLNPA